MPSLEDYDDVDNEPDFDERMADQEIVTEVLNNRQNSASDDDKKVSKTPTDETE